MHAAAIVLVCLLAWARPSHQYPSRLQRTTGCRCSIANSTETHAFWLQPPQLENPGDTCRRLGDQLSHWLNWIDGHADLQTAWQLYDDLLQNRQANRAVALKKALSQTTAGEGRDDNNDDDDDGRPGEAAAEKGSQVSCQIEGMDETLEGGGLSDMLLVRVFLGAILLLVLFESLSTIWWSLGRGLSKTLGRANRTGSIRL